jgi:hypothetical protein
MHFRVTLHTSPTAPALFSAYALFSPDGKRWKNVNEISFASMVRQLEQPITHVCIMYFRRPCMIELDVPMLGGFAGTFFFAPGDLTLETRS